MTANSEKPLNVRIALAKALAGHDDVAGRYSFSKIRIDLAHQVIPQHHRIGLALQGEPQWHDVTVNTEIVAELPATPPIDPFHRIFLQSSNVAPRIGNLSLDRRCGNGQG